jgi:hypothetical protein
MVRQGSPALSRGSSMRHFDVVGGFGLRNVVKDLNVTLFTGTAGGRLPEV